MCARITAPTEPVKSSSPGTRRSGEHRPTDQPGQRARPLRPAVSRSEFLYFRSSRRFCSVSAEVGDHVDVDLARRGVNPVRRGRQHRHELGEHRRLHPARRRERQVPSCACQHVPIARGARPTPPVVASPVGDATCRCANLRDAITKGLLQRRARKSRQDVAQSRVQVAPLVPPRSIASSSLAVLATSLPHHGHPSGR